MCDQFGLKLMRSPVHATAFFGLAKPAIGKPVTLLIGPEAGFSDREESLAQSAGLQTTLLRPRVMPTKTIALAPLAAIHAPWRDFVGGLQALEQVTAGQSLARSLIEHAKQN